MLSDDIFANRLTVLKDCFEMGDYVQAFHLSHLLKQEVFKEAPVEAAQLGWARYYGFRSLFMLQKFQEAWNYLEQKEPHIYILPSNDAALIYHNAMELVVRLEKTPKELVRWGQKAVDLKLAANDLPGVVDSINTLCTLLGLIDQDQFNGKYAEKLIEMGIEYQADRLIIGGMAHLLRNPGLRTDPDLNNRVRERHSIIDGAFNGPFKSEAAEIYEDYLNFWTELKSAA